jgi:hypothetical protein
MNLYRKVEEVQVVKDVIVNKLENNTIQYNTILILLYIIKKINI